MKELPSSKDAIKSLFHYMTLRFDGEKYPDLEATFQFVFTDINNGFPISITFSHGKAEVHEGLNKNAIITVHSPSDIWLDISGGFRNPVWALITTKYKVEGELSYLKLLPKLLTRKIAVPKSQVFSERWTVPSTTFVLIGNPRKKNGFTYFYLQPFLEGLKSSGTRIEEIFLYDKEIKDCLGCFNCWTKTPGKCVQKDDQAELIEKFESAELIIYAMPLYVYSMPGLVKSHLDRLLPIVHPFVEKIGSLTRHPRRVSIKQSMVLFSLCGFPEIHHFAPLGANFEAISRSRNVPLIAKVLIPGAMELYYNPTERALLLEKLNYLRLAGEQIAKKGVADKRTLKVISKVKSDTDKWHDYSNMYWFDEMQKSAFKETNNITLP